MRGPRCLLLFGLAGCNQIYGLDETRLPTDENDEDVDGSPNFADNCPTIANGDQTDGDGDDVGDACDPHPAAPGDAIAARVFFNEPVRDAKDWRAQGWVFRDGYAEHAAIDMTGMLGWPRAIDGTKLIVEAGFVVTALGSSEFGNELGVRVDDHRCFLNLQRPDMTRLSIDSDPGPFLQPPVGPNGAVRMLATHDRTASTITCRAGSAMHDASIPASPPSAHAIYTNGNAAQLHYVVVYATGG